MANELSFTTRVDLSGLNSGLGQATAATNNFGNNSAAAMARAKSATDQLTEAQTAFGQAAQAGSAAAAGVIAEYQSALDEANAAVQRLTVSTIENTVAEEDDTAAVRSGTSARMAAAAEIRTLEGNLNGSTRAAAAFLSTLPGVGAAMQAAFPIFGAVAILEILGQIAGKVHAVADEFFNLTSMEKVFHDQLIRDGEDEIQSSNKFLVGLREQRVLEAELTGGRKGRSDRGGAAGAAFDTTQDKVNLQGLQDSLKATQDDIKRITAEAHLGESGMFIDPQAQARDKILLEELASTAQSTEAKIQAARQKSTDDQEKETLRRKEAGEKSGGNPDATLLRSYELELDALKQSQNVTLKQEHDFWAERVDTLSAGSSQYASIMGKIAAEDQEGAKKGAEAFEKYKKEQQTLAVDQSSAGVATTNENHTYLIREAEDLTQAGERWHEYNAAVTKGQEAQTQASANLQLAAVAANLASGGITKVGADQQTAAIHAAEYTAKLKELEAELAKLNSTADRDALGRVSNPQQAAQIQSVQNQITQTQGQSNVGGLNDTAKTAQEISQPFVTAFTTINQQWLQVQNSLIFGTNNISRQFANMGVHILESVASSFEQMLVKALSAEIRMTIAHQIANDTKTASDITAAATADSVSAASALRRVTHEAAVAAAGAWSALSPIPIVGPVLGAVAAAGTYAGVLALAAFETGGIIPNTGVALVHQGEAVLPANLTQMLMSTANSSTSNANSKMTNNFYGDSDADFRNKMKRNSRQLVHSVSRGLRNAGKA